MSLDLEHTLGELSPLKQGTLDSLCGVYAILNLTRLENSALSDKAAYEIFTQAINALATDGCLAGAVREGISPHDLPWLWKQCGRNEILKQYSEPSPKKSLALIEAAHKDGTQGAIIFLKWPNGDFDHYTVVQSLEPDVVRLFDNYVFKEIDRYGDKLFINGEPVRIADVFIPYIE